MDSFPSAPQPDMPHPYSPLVGVSGMDTPIVRPTIDEAPNMLEPKQTEFTRPHALGEQVVRMTNNDASERSDQQTASSPSGSEVATQPTKSELPAETAEAVAHEVHDFEQGGAGPADKPSTTPTAEAVGSIAEFTPPTIARMVSEISRDETEPPVATLPVINLEDMDA